MPEYSTAIDRSNNQDALDENISGWTSQFTADEVMSKLQQNGVAASVVSQGEDLYDSPHLKARGFYRPTPYYVAERGTAASQWEEGTSLSWNMPFRMSEPPVDSGHYSNIGEDNSYVFEELLGMDPEKVKALAEQEVIF